jgi:transposase
MSWASWDTASQRMVIVQLYKTKIATQQDLSQVFGIHINSVQKYIADFTNAGLEGLIAQRSGPKERWKITPQLRSKILILVLKEGILGYEAIQKRLEAWNEQVSIASIRQVLIDNGLVNERVRVGDIEVVQAGLFDSKDEQQLELPFTYISGLVNKEERYLELETNRIENREENSFTVFNQRALRYYSQAQRRYLDQLERGYYNTYAGDYFLFLY